MSAVDLARLQFATTSIYHFLFVPLTIGLAFLTAILQTLWYRKGHPEHLRLTRFFGTLLVINVAVGVVTGLVQEFQFGMNWSAYSRFVGDVFGAPLAMEGLAAFFLESVFLGLWLFGWDRLSKRVHLATIWAVAVGGVLSAAFIMAANSWMQRPVGYQINAAGPRPAHRHLGGAHQPVFLWGYLHVLAASLVTGGRRHARGLGLAPAARLQPRDVPAVGQAGHRGADPRDHVRAVRRRPAGHQRDHVPADEDRRGRRRSGRPASRARSRCSRSAAATTTRTPTKIIEVPHLLSLLATGTWNGQVVGLNELQPQDEQQYGPATTCPTSSSSTGRCGPWPTWSLVCCGAVGWLADVAQAARRRPGGSCGWPSGRPLPFLMNTAGWLLTENGRQPWIVQGLQLTRDAVSPSVSTTTIASASASSSCSTRLSPSSTVFDAPSARKELAPDPDRPRPRRRRPRSTSPTEVAMTLVSSGSSSSPCSGRGSSSSRGSTSASACSTAWSDGTRGPPGRHRHHRAALGRQRGLADRGRGRDVRRLPRLVRDHVLAGSTWFFVLLLVALIVRGVSFEFRGHPRADRGRRHWSRGTIGGSCSPPCCSASPSATCWPGCRSGPTRSTPGCSPTCAPLYLLFTGATVVLLCLLHGASFLVLNMVARSACGCCAPAC